MDEDLLRYRHKQKYCLFDYETEGTNLYLSKPWQLAWLLAEGKNITKVEDHYLWWENLNISEGAARATKFNYSVYKSKAVDPKPVLEKFEEILYDEDYIILYHNGLSFDAFIHNTYRRLMGKKPDYSFLKRCIDTHLLAKAIKLNIPVDKDNFLPWMYKLQSFRQKGLKTNLTALGKEYEIEHDYENLHNARVDIDLNFKVFLKQIWQIEI